MKKITNVNVKRLLNTYVIFTSLEQLEYILDVFKRLDIEYKNGTLDDLYNKVEDSYDGERQLDKITFKEQCVVTSKEKNNTIPFRVFQSIVGESVIENTGECMAEELYKTTNPTTPMRKKTQYANKAEKLLAEKKVNKAYKNEKFLEDIVNTGESLTEKAKNLIQSINVAEEKTLIILKLKDDYDEAVDRDDLEAIEKIGKQIKDAIEYVTKGNKIIASLNAVGSDVAKIKKSKEDEPKTGAEIIGDIVE